jgi:hypothetical protein
MDTVISPVVSWSRPPRDHPCSVRPLVRTAAFTAGDHCSDPYSQASFVATPLTDVEILDGTGGLPP